jgi:hypothetical protein
MKTPPSFAFSKTILVSFLVLPILFSSAAFARAGLRCIRHDGGQWVTTVSRNAVSNSTLKKSALGRLTDSLAATATVSFSCLRDAAAGDTSFDTVYFTPAKQGNDTAILVFGSGAAASADTITLVGRCELPTGVLASMRMPQIFSFAAQAVDNSVLFRYGLPVASRVDLEIYDALGRATSAPVREVQQAGYHDCEWATHGRSRGVYFCKFTATPTQGLAHAFMRTERVVIR